MSESEVRQLRDQLYGKPISEKEWRSCAHNWLRPDSQEWLRDEVAKQQRKNQPCPAK